MEVLTKARFESEPNEREKRNLQVAYDAACESIVLLENDGALPIQLGKVALYGAGAMRTVKGGGGSGEVNERHSVTIYEGMKAAGFDADGTSPVATATRTDVIRYTNFSYYE